MLSMVFRGDDLPAEQRFDAWRELSGKAVLRTLMDSDRAADFRATLRAGGLGPVQVSAMTYQSLRSRRTPALIRAADPELYQLALVRGGRQCITWRDRELALGHGELLFYDSSHPFTAEIRTGEVAASSVVVQVPRELLPMDRDRADGLLGTRVPPDDPVGVLLRQFIDAVARPAGAGLAPYTATDAGRLGLVLTDLLTALLSRQYERRPGAAVAASGRGTQLLCVQAFIERHLGDADLSPAAVAAAHHVSLRSLHRLFEPVGLGVAGWIRARRLDRCRRDLADPALSRRTVRAIGATWGFPRPADFNRAFRAAYGLSPGEYRRLAGAPTVCAER
ncbi:helix-turn-helix domain-containing protein [Streptomyces youssoufiensis]